MNNRYEEEDKLLIISPTESDFDELKVKFEEKNAEVLYLAQLRGRDDENAYDTYVFYHKGDKSFIFYEYENPGSLSYHSETEEGSIKNFWEKLSELESNSYEKGRFFKYSEIDFNYKELEASLAETVTVNTKPKKMKM